MYDSKREDLRNQLIRERAQLSAEQKFEIANGELDSLRKNIEEGREKSEHLLEKLKAILEGTDINISEIRKEAFDFGRFLSQSENGKTGKYDADKLVKYMEDKFRQKEALIAKLQLKNVSLKSQIMKADQQIKHKEEMGDDLKFIDFHQLQIENKKHVKDIDERNKKLVQLKHTKGKTEATLNKLKSELAKSDVTAADKEEIDKMKIELEEIKRDLGAEGDKTIPGVYRDIMLLVDEKQKIGEYIKQVKGMPTVKDYVDKKHQYTKLQKDAKNWN